MLAIQLLTRLLIRESTSCIDF